MASKFTYEINLDTKGYVDGVKQGKDANADFATSIKKVKDDLPNLKKELNAARKEAQGLTLAYSKLSDAEKASGFGKALAREMEEAKRKAAELVDMTGDLQTELKNMASDTALWDATKEGIGIAKDAMTGLIATTAQLAGKEKELQPLIAKIAQVQSLANTAIGIGNALQKQSAIMLGIRKVQEAALAKAITLETSATKGATVAQKAFNMVAKANPYVLLATAILALGGALVAFTLKANSATDSTTKLNKEIHEASIQGQKDAQNDIAKLDILYSATQNVNLSIEERKKAVKQLQDQYPAYFSNMSTEQIMLGQASSAYQQLKDDIIAVAQAKAYEQRIADLGKEKVELEDQLEVQKRITAEREKQAKSDRNGGGGMVPGMTSFGTGAQELGSLHSIQNSIDKENELQKQIDEKTAAQERYIDKINETTAAQNRLNQTTNKPTGGGGGSTNNDVKAATGSIVELENRISELQKKLKNGLVPEQDIKKTVDEINNLKSQVKELNIKYGFEKPEKAKTKLEQLQAQLAEHQKAFIIAVDSDDKEAQQAALKAYYEVQEELDKYQASIKIEPRIDPNDIAKQKGDIQKIVNDALSTKTEVKYDFSSLPQSMQDAANKALEEYKRIEDARKKLTDIMNNENSTDAQISAAQEGLDQLHEKWQQVTEDVNLYNEANKEISTTKKRMEALSDSVTQVGNAVSAAASLFSALGEAGEDNDMKAMGIVAQAIATIALSFAQALTTAKTWVDWLAFGISGLATMTTMITQVKSLTAGSYANGGIVGGHSYYGDKLFARVNSGEGIFNEKQMKSLNEQLDSKKIAAIGAPTTVYVTGKIQGKDLLLVQKNANKIMSKSGQQINL